MKFERSSLSNIESMSAEADRGYKFERSSLSNIESMSAEADRGINMTQIKKKTLEMIERLPDDKVVYVFNILQNIEAFSTSQPIDEIKEAQEAFETLMKFQGTLPEDFDYKTELERARDEKFGSSYK